MVFGQLGRSFVGLRHKQLVTDAWLCHSSVDIVYCAYTIVKPEMLTSGLGRCLGTFGLGLKLVASASYFNSI